MSFQVGTTCFGTLEAAASALAAQESGRVVPAGASVFVLSASPAEGGAITYTRHDITGTVADVSETYSPAIQPCQLLGAADGVDLVWKIALVWFVGFTVPIIRKALGY